MNLDRTSRWIAAVWWRRFSVRLLGWWLVAAAVTWPAVLQPAQQLLGAPGADVWNHAWGFWYVAEALGRGVLPYHTTLLGAPEGGVLYFIDNMGALLGLPLTWTAGPAVAYNLVQIARVAAAGVAAQLLAEEVTGRGLHTWLAGVAYATTPYLLCELGNGISEVCAVSGIAFTLWAAARAFRLRRTGAWVVLGLLWGLTTVSTFYYGLAASLLLAMYAAWRLLGDGDCRRRALPLLAGLVAAAAVAALLAVPAFMAFQASLEGPGAFIERPGGMDWSLLAHNAVDPRTYIWPGDFQSVDLRTKFGEHFRHTGYLRWSLLLMAAVGLWTARRRRLWIWLALTLLSAGLGLGYALYMDGYWLGIAGHSVTLPFYWVNKLLPQVAITHPLRMSVGAHATLALLAAAGLAALSRRLQRAGRGRWGWLLLGGALLAVVAESLFGSAATWPVPRSPARVPLAAYQGLARGPLLDLPMLVGSTMSMQRYFWYQTRHHHPLPYPPDIQYNRSRDPATTAAFRCLARTGVAPEPSLATHLRRRYVAILVHTTLETRINAGLHRLALEQMFGPPEALGTVLRWRLR